MPEGDTVWLAGRRLHAALAGSVVTRSDFRVPQLAAADLCGATVTEVVSRGKHLLTRLQGAAPPVPEQVTLHTHFRMDGTWHLYRRGAAGARWRGGPDWQVRVVLETAGWQAVGYRLPVVELLPTAEEDRAVGHLGPDLLDPAFDAGEALRRLREQPGRTVGEALLDQRLVAGIGTLYRAETLFLRGVHPRTPVGDVADLRAVVDLARRLLSANREQARQVTTGDLRRGQHHWVYGRAGQPCRRCGTPVEVEEYGPAGQERLSYWCPRCQPAPRTTPTTGTTGRG